MFASRGTSLPLSPIRVAGLLARPLPPALLQPIISGVFSSVMNRHPDLFERLSCIPNPVFAIDPVDLPLVFELDTRLGHARLSAARTPNGREVATIRGPLLALLQLLEGRVDGDALFFSRTLTIDGDTEAVVALRNAIDDADIDLREDILTTLGPLAAPARHALGLGERIYARLNRDLEFLRGALHHTQPKGPDA